MQKMQVRVSGEELHERGVRRKGTAMERRNNKGGRKSGSGRWEKEEEVREEERLIISSK